MAEQRGLNYYTAGFEYSMTPGQEGTDVNLKYDFIINCIDVKRRYHNYFLREDFDVDKIRERGDKGLFAATLRPSYDYCWSPADIEGPVGEQDRYLYEGSTQVIEGNRHDYWVNKDKTEYLLSVRKMTKGTKCDQYNNLFCQKVLVCFKTGDRMPCDSTNIVRTLMPGGEYYDTGVTTVSNIELGDTYTGYVSFSDGITGLGIGSYVLINDIRGGQAIDVGQYRKIVGIDDGGYILDAAWAGLSGTDSTTTIRARGYQKIKTVGAYVTSTGVEYMTDTDCSEEVIYRKKERSQSAITGLVSGSNGELFALSDCKLTIIGGASRTRIFDREIDVGSDYDDLLRVNNYTILLGPNNVGIGYYSGKDQDQAMHFEVARDVAGFGYFNRGSYVFNNTDGFQRGADQFVLVNHRGMVRNYEILPTDDNTGKVTFTLNRSNVMERYMNTDIRSMLRDRGDKVYLSSDMEFLFAFIVNETPEKIRTNTIIKYIQHYKHYMQWMHCDEDIVILGQRDYSFFGNAHYAWGKNTYDTNRAGDKSYIYQAVAGMFGDLTELSPKIYASFEISLGEDTHFSGGRHRFQMNTLSKNGYEETYNRGSLHRTSFMRDLNYVRGGNKGGEVYRVEGSPLLMGEQLYRRDYGVEQDATNYMHQNKKRDEYKRRCDLELEELNQKMDCIDTEFDNETNCKLLTGEVCKPKLEDSTDLAHDKGGEHKALLRGRYGVIREDTGIEIEGEAVQYMLECNQGNYFTLHSITLGFLQKDTEEFSSGSIIPTSWGRESSAGYV